MNTISAWGLRASILTYALLHFLTAFWTFPSLEHVLSIAGLSMFFFSLWYIPIRKFKLPIFIFIVGMLVLYYSGTPLLSGIASGMLQMRNIIGLLIVVPLISWVLREEPYIEDIMALFHKFINTSRKFYASMTVFTQVISYFLLFGSITMMYQFVDIILKEKKTEVWEHFKGTALLRGFALSTLWVISIPSFIFAVETLGVSLWIAILQGFGIAVVGTILAVLFFYGYEKRQGIDLTPDLQKELTHILTMASSKEVQVKKVVEFAILFLTLFGSIFFLHGYFEMKLMLLIPVVIVFWVSAFYVVKRKSNKLPQVVDVYVKKDLLNQAYQLNVMATVGILIYALQHTAFAQTVVSGLNYMQDHYPFINPLYLLPFIVIILGFMGLGPLTVMVLVAGILQGMALPYPPELIVLAVTSGSVISILLSPLIMPVIALSASNGISLFTNGIKFNWKYAIAFYVIVQLYIQTMIHFWQ